MASSYTLLKMNCITEIELLCHHDDVIKWKHLPQYWPFVRGIHRSPVNSPHKSHWRGALMFSLICVWINGWVNNSEAGDLRRYRARCDVIVMILLTLHHEFQTHNTKLWYYDYCYECHSACNALHFICITPRIINIIDIFANIGDVSIHTIALVTPVCC